MGLIIREITGEDYENISALAVQVWLNTYAGEGICQKISQFVFSEFTPQNFKKQHLDAGRTIFVAVNGEHLLGFVSIDLGSFFNETERYGVEVTKLYVHDRFHRQGIGGQLLERGCAAAGGKIWLSTWVHNTAAIAFYKKKGFRQVGTTMFDIMGEKHENYVFSIG